MALKIVGGSFGASGTAYVDSDPAVIKINGSDKLTYPKEHIQQVLAQQAEGKKFSVISLLLGLFIVTPVLAVLFNVIGLVIGVVLSIVGSSYKRKESYLDVSLKDGKSVRLFGSTSEVNKFARILG